MAGAVVLVLALGLALLYLNRRDAARADLARRAPVVVADPVTSCALSPGGRYLWLRNGRAYAVGVAFDLARGAAVRLPLGKVVPGGAAIWLGEHTLLLVTRSTTVNLAENSYQQAEDGWLVDVPAGTVTALGDLAPDARAAALGAAGEHERTLGEHFRTPLPSPDGRYLAYGASIRDSEGEMLNRATGGVDHQPCLDGWRPDSTGLYYIENHAEGLTGRGPGPVRLLLAQPPPPKPWWRR